MASALAVRVSVSNYGMQSPWQLSSQCGLSDMIRAVVMVCILNAVIVGVSCKKNMIRIKVLRLQVK